MRHHKHTAINTPSTPFSTDIYIMDQELLPPRGLNDLETFQKISEIFETWDKKELLAMIKQEISATQQSGQTISVTLYTGHYLEFAAHKLNQSTLTAKDTYFASYLLAGFATETHGDTEKKRDTNNHAISTPGQLGAEGIVITGTGFLLTLSMKAS